MAGNYISQRIAQAVTKSKSPAMALRAAPVEAMLQVGSFGVSPIPSRQCCHQILDKLPTDSPRRSPLNSGSQTQRGESPQAERAYRIYRDLGPSRCLAEAWRIYRETPPIGKSRGRPRLAHAEAGPPSGQWTTWSTGFHWVERAAEYDAQVDAEKLRSSMEKQSSKVELELQECCERLVWELEARLDTMANLSITSSTECKQKFEGKHVTTTTTQSQGIDLFAYAMLEGQANEAARWAIEGIQISDLWPGAPDGQSSTTSTLNPAGAASNCSFTGSTDRLHGESASAYRAFCAYRDLGSKRSLVAARMADRKDSAPGAKGSAGHWPAWSKQFHWVARAKAYDAMLKSTEERCRAQIQQRRLDFQMANEKRIDARISKTLDLLSRAARAPMSTTTRTETTRFEAP